MCKKKPVDELYEDAKKIVLENKNTKLSFLQRKLCIGYYRTVRLMEALEENGVVSKHKVRGLRDILIEGKD